jgi:hypothetical protein
LRINICTRSIKEYFLENSDDSGIPPRLPRSIDWFSLSDIVIIEGGQLLHPGIIHILCGGKYFEKANVNVKAMYPQHNTLLQYFRLTRIRLLMIALQVDMDELEMQNVVLVAGSRALM